MHSLSPLSPLEETNCMWDKHRVRHSLCAAKMKNGARLYKPLLLWIWIYLSHSVVYFILSKPALLLFWHWHLTANTTSQLINSLCTMLVFIKYNLLRLLTEQQLCFLFTIHKSSETWSSGLYRLSAQTSNDDDDDARACDHVNKHTWLHVQWWRLVWWTACVIGFYALKASTDHSRLLMGGLSWSQWQD